MDRELLGRIQSAIPIVAKAEEHSVEIEKWRKKINSVNIEKSLSTKPTKMWEHVMESIVGMPIVLLIVGIIYLILPQDITSDTTASMYIFFGFLVIVLAVWIWYKIFIRKYMLKLFWEPSHNKEMVSYDAMLAKYNQEIAVHQNEINRITSQNIELLEMLPPDYLYVFALNSLSDILINRRADTLKEALAVYEDDMHKQAMRDGQDELYRRQNVLEQAIGDVSDMAYSAQQKANSAYYRN